MRRSDPIYRNVLATAALFGTILSPALHASQPIDVNERQVQQSNAFVENLYRLHLKQLEGRQWREQEVPGGYRDHPNFYREVTYLEAKSGRPLSRIGWERRPPNRIHSIEVYVHDSAGRLVRGYLAWFLPDHRNAPRQTAINFYAYNGGTRSWRQFDGSGLRIYEKCTKASRVLVELWDDDISRAEDDERSIMYQPVYRQCFDGVPLEIAQYEVVAEDLRRAAAAPTQ
jgi:hypothetical protein